MGDTPLWVVNIRQLLAAKGWSQQLLAEKSGVDKNTVSNILTGKTSPSVRMLEALTGPAALNVPMYRLFVDDRQAGAIERHDQADAAATNEAAVEERLKRKWLEEMARDMGMVVTTPMAARPVPVPQPTQPTVVKRSRKRA